MAKRSLVHPSSEPRQARVRLLLDADHYSELVQTELPSAQVALWIATANLTRRFEREAEVLAHRRHPGIVRYVAHGTRSGGQAFLAMECWRARASTPCSLGCR